MYKALSAFTVAFILLAHCGYAQFNIKVGGKQYYIRHFQADTVFSFDNRFVKDSILPSIKQSAYDLEIRYNFYGAFGWMPGEGHCIVIRGTKDNLFAVDYFLKQFHDNPDNRKHHYTAVDSGMVIHKYDIKRLKDWRMGVGLHIRPLAPAVSLPVLLQKLLANHVTDLPTDKLIESRLKSKGVELKGDDCNDCEGIAYYEVKIGRHFRNFITTNAYTTYNQHIPEIRNESELDKVFHQLVPNFIQ